MFQNTQLSPGLQASHGLWCSSAVLTDAYTYTPTPSAMIQPGLERISLLLKNVDFPWKAIHVAGTNGKGSVCAYANAMLRSRDIRCGRFTSPHLVDRYAVT